MMSDTDQYKGQRQSSDNIYNVVFVHKYSFVGALHKI